jgi:16S rRNA (guanine966-N2)-methyltransferase
MRIIAGEFRGRTLKSPGDRRVRPTADRVREAWFSILASDIPGAHVLDLFAGSGALGLEALSRGAKSVDFVEISKSSLDTLRANVAILDAEERVQVHRADALRFVSQVAPGTFDVALADPPYTTGQAARLVESFRQRPFSSILSVEHRASLPLAGDDTRRYGEVALTFCYAP